MNYLRCISNKGFIWQNGKLLDEEVIGLTVGVVYKVLPTSPSEHDNGFVRVIDNSGEDYLYPADRFEPFTINGQSRPTATLSAHVPDWLRDVIQAEAIAADKSVSALLREWIEERLDLATA